MPLFNTATAAAALDVTHKWLDNLLSHNDIDALRPDTQGVSRKLSLSVVATIALTKELIDEIGLPSTAALRLANRILREPTGTVLVSPWLTISLDVESFRAQVLDRLAHAVESAPTPRRGRPPKR